MSHTIARLLVPMTAVLGLGCQTLLPEPSFRVPEPEFRQRVQRICHEGVYTEFWTTELAPRAWRISEFLVWKLEHGGFEIEREGFWDTVREAREEAGGAFDRHTGRVIPERKTAVDAAVATAIEEEHGCHARLRLRIDDVRAPFVGSTARWDGVERTYNDALFGGGEGSLGALSLWIEMKDLEQNPLYERSGGIQTLVRRTGTIWVVHNEAVEEAELFVNGGWNAEAVLTALGPLAGAVPPEVAACEIAPESDGTPAKRGNERARRETRARCEWEHFEANHSTTWEAELARIEAEEEAPQVAPDGDSTNEPGSESERGPSEAPTSE